MVEMKSETGFIGKVMVIIVLRAEMFHFASCSQAVHLSYCMHVVLPVYCSPVELFVCLCRY